MTSESTDDSAVARNDESSGGSDSGQIALIILVVLAIGASVIMLFTDSNSALKLALIAALWAAIIGFFLVYRYRAQAKKSASEMHLKEQLHSVQLEKAQREARISKELASRGGEDLTAELLTELKLEIAALRSQLEELSGQPLAYEPEAIRAEARRVLEVEGRAPSNGFTLIDDTEPTKFGITGEQKAEPSVQGKVRPEAVPSEPGVAHEPLRVVDESEPVTAEQTAVPAPSSDSGVSGVAGTGVPSPDAVAGRLGNQDFRRQSTPNPLSALITENSRRAQEDRAAGEPSAQQRPAVKAEQVEPEETKESKAPETLETPETPEEPVEQEQPEAVDKSEPTEAAEDETSARGGGRRRRDENEGGISVADLLKNINRDEQ